MLVQKISTIMVWPLFHTIFQSFYLIGHFTIISLIWIQNCCRDQKIPSHIWGFPYKRIPYLRNNEYNKIKREKMGFRSSLKSGSHKPEFDCILDQLHSQQVYFQIQFSFNFLGTSSTKSRDRNHLVGLVAQKYDFFSCKAMIRAIIELPSFRLLS